MLEVPGLWGPKSAVSHWFEMFVSSFYSNDYLPAVFVELFVDITPETKIGDLLNEDLPRSVFWDHKAASKLGVMPSFRCTAPEPTSKTISEHKICNSVASHISKPRLVDENGKNDIASGNANWWEAKSDARIVDFLDCCALSLPPPSNEPPHVPCGKTDVPPRPADRFLLTSKAGMSVFLGYMRVADRDVCFGNYAPPDSNSFSGVVRMSKLRSAIPSSALYNPPGIPNSIMKSSTDFLLLVNEFRPIQLPTELKAIACGQRLIFSSLWKSSVTESAVFAAYRDGMYDRSQYNVPERATIRRSGGGCMSSKSSTYCDACMQRTALLYNKGIQWDCDKLRDWSLLDTRQGKNLINMGSYALPCKDMDYLLTHKATHFDDKPLASSVRQMAPWDGLLPENFQRFQRFFEVFQTYVEKRKAQIANKYNETSTTITGHLFDLPEARPSSSPSALAAAAADLMMQDFENPNTSAALFAALGPPINSPAAMDMGRGQRMTIDTINDVMASYDINLVDELAVQIADSKLRLHGMREASLMLFERAGGKLRSPIRIPESGSIVPYRGGPVQLKGEGHLVKNADVPLSASVVNVISKDDMDMAEKVLYDSEQATSRASSADKLKAADQKWKSEKEDFREQALQDLVRAAHDYIYTNVFHPKFKHLHSLTVAHYVDAHASAVDYLKALAALSKKYPQLNLRPFVGVFFLYNTWNSPVMSLGRVFRAQMLAKLLQTLTSWLQLALDFDPDALLTLFDPKNILPPKVTEDYSPTTPSKFDYEYDFSSRITGFTDFTISRNELSNTLAAFGSLMRFGSSMQSALKSRETVLPSNVITKLSKATLFRVLYEELVKKPPQTFEDAVKEFRDKIVIEIDKMVDPSNPECIIKDFEFAKAGLKGFAGADVLAASSPTFAKLKLNVGIHSFLFQKTVLIKQQVALALICTLVRFYCIRLFDEPPAHLDLVNWPRPAQHEGFGPANRAPEKLPGIYDFGQHKIVNDPPTPWTVERFSSTDDVLRAVDAVALMLHMAEAGRGSSYENAFVSQYTKFLRGVFTAEPVDTQDSLHPIPALQAIVDSRRSGWRQGVPWQYFTQLVKVYGAVNSFTNFSPKYPGRAFSFDDDGTVQAYCSALHCCSFSAATNPLAPLRTPKFVAPEKYYYAVNPLTA